MKTFRLLTILFLFASPLMATAAETAQSDADCAALLERWATDPKAAPKAVINACKEQLAQSAAQPVATAPARIAATDPCAGPGAADSVLCWGPWASVAPAAGFSNDPAQPPIPDREICDARTEQCQPLVDIPSPPPPPDPPLGSCTPGTPCGFATVVAGTSSSDDAEDTAFARFDMAADGSQFTVSPEGGADINSVSGMGTSFSQRNDDYENMRSTGRVGDEQSRITARVVRDDEDQVLLAADVWSHGNRANQTSQSGYFAWGTATSQAGLDTLNAGNVSVNFSGPMSVDNRTMGSMTVDFGTNPTWTGTWTNPGYSFGAGGVVSGADMISLPGQFTENVVADQSFVQGVLLGEPGGARGIAHIIDVTLAGQDRIKDVGLLREVIAD